MDLTNNKMEDNIAEAIYNTPYEENLIEISIGDYVLPIITTKETQEYKKYYLFNKILFFRENFNHKALYTKDSQIQSEKLTPDHWIMNNRIVGPVFAGLYKAFFLNYKKPIIKDNTFIVWEPCSKSHSEVVPGYVKYLLDLGYHVSVCVNPDRYKEGLFSRFDVRNKNLSLNNLNKREIRTFFKKDNLKNVAGVLVTTVGKLCDEIHYQDCYKSFNKDVDKSKVFFVEHEAKFAIDSGTWNQKLITLRKLNYKDAKSIVVNPHYFGDVEITPKNSDITNFITIGAIRTKRKNVNLFVQAAEELLKKGINNFKITVIGKGKISDFPKNLQPYFDIKGRLDFADMYKEIEKADFMLTSYQLPKHIRYNTTGTSGNFQLVYGFLKPIIIKDSFAEINGFTNDNSVIYHEDKDFADTLMKCISMTSYDYKKLQKNLSEYQQKLASSSLTSLKELING